MVQIGKQDYKPFKPKPASLCLCGSGKKFRDCCSKRLPGRQLGRFDPFNGGIPRPTSARGHKGRRCVLFPFVKHLLEGLGLERTAHFDLHVELFVFIDRPVLRFVEIEGLSREHLVAS